MKPSRNDLYRRIPLSAEPWHKLKLRAKEYGIQRTRLVQILILEWLKNPRPPGLEHEVRPHSQRGVKRPGPRTDSVHGIEFPTRTPETMEEWEQLHRAEVAYMRLVNGKLNK